MEVDQSFSFKMLLSPMSVSCFTTIFLVNGIISLRKEMMSSRMFPCQFSILSKENYDNWCITDNGPSRFSRCMGGCRERGYKEPKDETTLNQVEKEPLQNARKKY